MNTPPTDGEFDDLLATSRVERAALERRRRHWSEQRRAESTTIVDVLLGAGEAPVTLHATGVPALSGRVLGVGADVVEVGTSARTWWVSLGAVCAVETAAAWRGDAGDRSDVTMADLLADLVGTGERVGVTLSSSAALHGEVLAVGDAVVLRCADPARDAVVELDGIVDVQRVIS